MINVDSLLESFDDLFGVVPFNALWDEDGEKKDCDKSAMNKANSLRAGKDLKYSVPSFPPVNVFIKEGDGSINFEFALAGYSKDDLKISMEESTNSLVLETSEEFNKKQSLEPEKVKWIARNMKVPSFSYRYTLPSQKFDFDSTDAKFENGILSISVKRNQIKGHDKFIKIK